MLIQKNRRKMENRKSKKHWKARNPYLHNLYIYTVYIWMRAKVFRLAVCRISRICAVICHVEDSHMRGDLHDIVPRGVANSTWRCNCNCNLDNLDNSWSGNANAIYGLEEVAWGLLIFFFSIFSIFDLHKSLFELILGDANCVRQIFNPWLSHVCT